MKTHQQSVMFRIGSNNEFDLYFARAALEEMEKEGVDSRRGSLPNAPPKRLLIPSGSPKRTRSCKYPSRSHRRGGSTSPRDRHGEQAKPLREDCEAESWPEGQGQRAEQGEGPGQGRGQGQEAHDNELREVKISVQLEPPRMNHSLLAPGPRLDFKCHSAPHSRSSSWRKAKRPGRDDRGGGGGGGGGGRPNDDDDDYHDEAGGCGRRDSVPFEESISARLERLRLLQAEDCCVVRNFATSSRGLINRGDSFKRKSFSVASDAGSNGSGLGDGSRSVSAHSIGGSTIGSSAEPPLFRVLMVGAHGVGKTALVQQFMTSEYMGALETSFDDDSERTVSVLLDGEETMIDIYDIPPDKDYKQYENVDAYVIVYSITDKSSFCHAVDILEEIMCDTARHPAIILVANKSDLLRSRQITSEEGRELCLKKDCKFIEVSAVLNHKVDDLLVGIVSQIRLHPQRIEKRKRQSVGELDKETTCSRGPKSLLQKLFKRHNFVSKSCDNLLVL